MKKGDLMGITSWILYTAIWLRHETIHAGASVHTRPNPGTEMRRVSNSPVRITPMIHRTWMRDL